ncbi:pyruvate formate lyase family protein [Novosphingobium sp. PP1Y]|uniref:pyruvate formate lyase family protein n=1 Tax=Novosphingobium sp. PP1Y TaxID=702113 RepID=UPI00030B2352|nr:pyruvate formate lyase family protein [Novosphingobium sp. PP1Y]
MNLSQAETLDVRAAPSRSARIERMRTALDTVRAGRFPISIEKFRLVTRAFAASEGQPQVIRVARALAAVLDEITIFIEPDDMLAGNLATKPGGLELTSLWAAWSEPELDALVAAGFEIDPADRPKIAELNRYWRDRSLTARMTSLYDDERVWPYAQLGVVLPPFRNREEGWGPGGMLGCGWGIHHEISQIIGVFDYETVLKRGLSALLGDAREQLSQTRILSAEDVQRADLLRAMIITLEAVIRFAGRLSRLAADLAEHEAAPARAEELRQMADTLQRIPAEPARTFREALQSLWIVLLIVLPSGVISLGRFDQLFGHYYDADLAAGRITEAAALEYLQWLRIRDSQIVITSGHTHRAKYGGLAKWHNCVIGGQTPDGRDATNPMSYLVLEAARTCPTPHPTITLRVHDETPPDLMESALQLIGTGIGIPALLGDRSCIDFLTREGVPLETARDYAVAGCLGVNIPGQSRTIAWPMCSAPLILTIALHGGVDPRTGNQVGPRTARLDECTSFAEVMDSLKTQLVHFIELQAEFNNITMQSYGECFPQPFESALTVGGIGASKNILGRTLLLENGSCINPIGMINVSDALAALRKVVFEDGTVSASDMLAHLAANWEGGAGEAARAQVQAAPKFGNDDDAADLIAAELYEFWAKCTEALTTVYGGNFKAAALTIGTANFPGGAALGATPDGRKAGDPLADEAVTPVGGRYDHGVLAALRSALKIDQVRWQSMSLDMRLHPDAMASPPGRQDVARMVRDYFAGGGKHIQFNVISTETLRAAQADPAAYADLIVRIGGCSAYFTQLARAVQDEIISREAARSIT